MSDTTTVLPIIPSVDDVADQGANEVPEVRPKNQLTYPVSEHQPFQSDLVDHPHHYQGHGMESIDVIEAFDLDFCLGNTVKYVLRAGKKDNEIQDLRKAIWYLARRIKQLEGK